MKIIRNLSQQTLRVPFETPKGTVTLSLQAKGKIKVDNNWTSKIAQNLSGRGILKIISKSDPKSDPKPSATTPPPYVPLKKNNKWRQ